MCAESGVGKSTLAAPLTRFGFPVWADDAVAYSCRRVGPAISVQLRFALRLSPSSHRLLASMPPLTTVTQPVPGLQQPITGLLVLQRARHGEPSVERLSAAAAFSAVVEHSYSVSLNQLDARRRFSENQLGLVTTVPRFRLRFPPARRSFSNLVSRLAAHLRTWAGTPRPRESVPSGEKQSGSSLQ